MRHAFAITALVAITAACGDSGGDTSTSDTTQPAVTASAEAPASEDSSDQPDADDPAATTLAPTADAPATTSAAPQQVATTAAQQVEGNETGSDTQETATTSAATTPPTTTTSTTIAQTTTTAAPTTTTSSTTSTSTSTTTTTEADPGIVVSALTCRWGASSINVTVKAEHRLYIPEGERGIDSVELISYNEFGNPNENDLTFGEYTLEWSGSAGYSSSFRDKDFADVRIVSHDGETTETIRLRKNEDPC